MTIISAANIPFRPGLTVKQPTLRDICSAATLDAKGQAHTGYEQYTAYVNVLCLKVENLLSPDVLSVLPQEEVDKLNIFTVLVSGEGYRELLHKALSFFIIEPIVFDKNEMCFVAGESRIDAQNYDELRRILLKLCRIESDDIIKPKFKSERSRSIFEKIQKGRKQMQAAKAKAGNDAYALPNVISALSAKHPSINLFNIWDLTISQVYDQFNRTYVNAQTDIIGYRWAAWGKDNFDFTTWFKNLK